MKTNRGPRARGRALFKRDSATRRGRRPRFAFSKPAWWVRRAGRRRERISYEQRRARAARAARVEFRKTKVRACDRKRRARSGAEHRPRRAKLTASHSCASVNSAIESPLATTQPCRSAALQRIYDIVAIVKHLVTNVCDVSERSKRPRTCQGHAHVRTAFPASKHS